MMPSATVFASQNCRGCAGARVRTAQSQVYSIAALTMLSTNNRCTNSSKSRTACDGAPPGVMSSRKRASGKGPCESSADLALSEDSEGKPRVGSVLRLARSSASILHDYAARSQQVSDAKCRKEAGSSKWSVGVRTKGTTDRAPRWLAACRRAR